jgi:hypothetical protein
MLQDLLDEANDDGLDVCLAESPLAESLAVQEEYQRRYRTAVEGISQVRGAPTFSGGHREPGRPNWHDAEHMSCWAAGAGVIFVSLVQEADAIRVLAGARPNPVERDAITLLPPGI